MYQICEDKYLKKQLHPPSPNIQAKTNPKKIPSKFIEKCSGLVSYNDRHHYLAEKPPRPSPTIGRPVFKCLPPPRFTLLKSMILKDFDTIKHLVPHPLFVLLGYPHLKSTLVLAEMTPTLNQFFDLLITLPQSTPEQDRSHKESRHLPEPLR